VTFEEKVARRCWSCTNAIPRRKLSTGAIAGMEGGMPETFAQLDEFLVILGASVERS
jgi:hypothetical protein